MRKELIKIGVILPLSGGDELFGSQGLQGAKMAVAEINAAGGVLGGRHFELVIEDEKTDLMTAIRKASKVMVQDRIDGSMMMIHKGRALRFKEITERPPKEKKEPVVARRKKPHIPPTDHPWRRFKIRKHPYDREKLIESQNLKNRTFLLW